MSDVQKRFEKKVAQGPGCRLWMGAIDSCGYGRFMLQKKARKANRVAWLLYRGQIPRGMGVLHSCDVRRCVAVEHLFLGTHTDNMQDAARKGRLTARLPGTQRPTAKLTESGVRWAREQFQSGKRTIKEMALELGVSYSTLQAAVARKRWSHVR